MNRPGLTREEYRADIRDVGPAVDAPVAGRCPGNGLSTTLVTLERWKADAAFAAAELATEVTCPGIERRAAPIPGAVPPAARV
jgi:hypothetical protein